MTRHSPEQVYFVSQHDFHVGDCPEVEPVILVEAALSHRYTDVRCIEVFDRPRFDPPRGEEARPVIRPLVPIDQRESVFYPDARPAAIILDHRAAQASSARPEPATRTA
jgi:hypothetical protein